MLSEVNWAQKGKKLDNLTNIWNVKSQTHRDRKQNDGQEGRGNGVILVKGYKAAVMQDE